VFSILQNAVTSAQATNYCISFSSNTCLVHFTNSLSSLKLLVRIIEFYKHYEHTVNSMM